MKEIKNILICGIGAIGSIYADKINKNNNNLKILVDEKRLEKYTKNPKIFNGKTLNLNYILPTETNFQADLIIIATKSDGLYEAINNIKNFIYDETIILSLLNGVNSEEIIAQKYGWKHVLLSYFIGHSAMRDGNNISHNGVGTIVFGSKNNTQNDKIETIKNFFNKCKIDYQTPQNMLRAYWLKYMLNVSSNQLSAILNLTFGQMQKNEKARHFLIQVMEEVRQIAIAEGVTNTNTMIDEALEIFDSMAPFGKTSMLQDVETKRITEVEIFAEAMINFGKKHSIPTPYNSVIKNLIEIIHENYKINQ